MSRVFRIGHASIQVDGLFATDPLALRSALEESWIPGTEVTRYKRSWRLSAYSEIEPNAWSGRIGSVKEGDLSTLSWDPVPS